MTAPQDPFQTPPPAGPATPRQYGPPPSGAPQESGAPAYGAPAYGAPAYGAPPADGQQPYGQPAYGQPYGQPAYGHHDGHRNGLGVAALVLGILALLTGWLLLGGLLGVAAVVFGVLGLGRVRRHEADNRGLAVAGIVLGVLGIVSAVAVVAIGATFFRQISSYSDCVGRSDGSQAAIDACARQFADDLTGR